jgi:hypothetical protein
MRRDRRLAKFAGDLGGHWPEHGDWIDTADPDAMEALGAVVAKRPRASLGLWGQLLAYGCAEPGCSRMTMPLTPMPPDILLANRCLAHDPAFQEFRADVGDAMPLDQEELIQSFDPYDVILERLANLPNMVTGVWVVETPYANIPVPLGRPIRTPESFGPGEALDLVIQALAV